ncbi:MAG: hypothetical protein A2289_19500 [Deltaproteobacteria bacterium RIFOXYA12_FULL_58_15]|nr:MAG: hypothetical protein A2289_19500 [Deltaproteobacteria bacterium RIFOXYA12_FULL_58_15]OGR10241.1 MAG: hypothetical protein A2341_22035 [Deltaproteobacteria bacterium RIFOXYB12_FULL_58_9]
MTPTSVVTLSAIAILLTSTGVAKTEDAARSHWALVLKVGEELKDDSELAETVLKTARLKLSSSGATVATSEQVDDARTALGVTEVSFESFATLLDGVSAVQGLLFEVGSDGQKLKLTVHRYDAIFDTWATIKVKAAPRPALKHNLRKKVTELSKPTKPKARPKGTEPGEIIKLGISVASLDGKEAKGLGLKKPQGARVTSISNAGVVRHSDLAVDDVITKIGRKKVQNPVEAFELLTQSRYGDTLTMEVWRGGEKMAVEFTVGAPAGPAKPAPDEAEPTTSSGSTKPVAETTVDPTRTESPKPPPTRKLGVRVRVVTPELATSLGLPAPTGAFVVSVLSGSAAEKAQLKANDIILTINERSVTHASELVPTVDATYPRQRLRMEVWRNKVQTTIDVELPNGQTTSLDASPATAAKSASSSL